MMKKYILIMLLTLAGLAGMAQTNEPLPSGAVQFSNQLWIVPSDSTIWTGDVFEGKFVNLGSWHKVDSLFSYGFLPSDTTNRYRFDGYAQITPNGHSSEGGMAQLSDGSLVYVYRFGEDGVHASNTGAIYGLKSIDTGKTWSAPYLIYDDPLYDDRNISVGPDGNGGVAVVFSKLNAPSTRIGAFAMTSSDGDNWSSLTEIGSGTTITPFGKIIERPGRLTVMFWQTSTGGYIYESTDNGVTWSQQSTVSGTGEDGEPFLVDLPNGKSIILSRNVKTPSDTSTYQYSSDDGYVFTLDGATNINYGNGLSAQSPVYAEIVGDDLIVFAPQRYGYPAESDQRDISATMQIYIADVNSIVGNETSYTLKHRVSRPYGDYLSIYGYPNGLNIDGRVVGIVTDRSYMVPSGFNSIGTNESAKLYAFQYYHIDDSKSLISSSSLYGGNQVKNTINGGFDYVKTINDERGFINTLPASDVFGAPSSGDMIRYDGAKGKWDKWTPTGWLSASTTTQAGIGNLSTGTDLTTLTGITAYAIAPTGGPTVNNGAVLSLRRSDGFGGQMYINAAADDGFYYGRFTNTGLQGGYYRVASREFLASNNIQPIQATQFRLSALNTAPASASATGTAGEIRFGTDGRIYICTGTNTWIRSDPLTTW